MSQLPDYCPICGRDFRANRVDYGAFFGGWVGKVSAFLCQECGFIGLFQRDVVDRNENQAEETEK